MHERAFTLRTARFNSTDSQPHFINDRCFGEDFAAWLSTALVNAGVRVSDPIQEDWGWCLIATLEGTKFTISIGVMDESIGQVPAEWRVGIAYERPMNGFLSIFKPVPTVLLDVVAAKVKNAVNSEPSISDVRDA